MRVDTNYLLEELRRRKEAEAQAPTPTPQLVMQPEPAVAQPLPPAAVDPIAAREAQERQQLESLLSGSGEDYKKLARQQMFYSGLSGLSNSLRNFRRSELGQDPLNTNFDVTSDQMNLLERAKAEEQERRAKYAAMLSGDPGSAQNMRFQQQLQGLGLTPEQVAGLTPKSPLTKEVLGIAKEGRTAEQEKERFLRDRLAGNEDYASRAEIDQTNRRETFDYEAAARLARAAAAGGNTALMRQLDLVKYARGAGGAKSKEDLLAHVTDLFTKKDVNIWKSQHGGAEPPKEVVDQLRQAQLNRLQFYKPTSLERLSLAEDMGTIAAENQEKSESLVTDVKDRKERDKYTTSTRVGGKLPALDAPIQPQATVKALTDMRASAEAVKGELKRLDSLMADADAGTMTALAVADTPGVKSLVSTALAEKIRQSYSHLTTQLKEIYKLGALSGGDMGLMEGVLPPTLSMQSLIGSRDRYGQFAEVLERTVGTTEEVNGFVIPEFEATQDIPASGGMPAIPKGAVKKVKANSIGRLSKLYPGMFRRIR